MKEPPRRRLCLTALGALAAFAMLAMTGGNARAQDAETCVNASEQALTLKRAEKLFESRALLTICASETCPAIVREVCQQRLERVRIAIPSILFAVHDGSGRDLAHVTVTIDGAASPNPLPGAPIALDPGEHEFKFEVLGEAPVVKRFILREFEQDRREEIVLGPVPVLAGTVPGENSSGRVKAKPLGTRRALALLSASVGVASIAAGAVTGELAIARVSESRANCPFDGTMQRCNATGVRAMSEARTFARTSDVTFAVGAVGVVGGIVLGLVKPRGDAPMSPEATTWSDPTSWSVSFAAVPHGSQGFVGHEF